MGVQPTGKRMEIRVVDLFKIQDGMITKTWHVEDWLTAMKQPGAMPRAEKRRAQNWIRVSPRPDDGPRCSGTDCWPTISLQANQIFTEFHSS